MQKVAESATIKAMDGWVVCPRCGKKKIHLILRTTRGQNIPAHCKLCGWDGLLNIIAPEP